MSPNKNSFYDRHFLTIEFTAALLSAVVVAASFEFVVGTDALHEALRENHQAIYGALASVAGSLLGFVLAAVSIILVFGAMGRFRILRQSSQYDTVFAIYFQTIYWLALTTVWGLLALLLQGSNEPRLWILYVTMWLVFVDSVRIYRCIWILRTMASLASSPRA